MAQQEHDYTLRAGDEADAIAPEHRLRLRDDEPNGRVIGEHDLEDDPIRLVTAEQIRKWLDGVEDVGGFGKIQDVREERPLNSFEALTTPQSLATGKMRNFLDFCARERRTAR